MMLDAMSKDLRRLGVFGKMRLPQQKRVRKGGSCGMDIRVMCDRDVDASRCNCPVFGQPQGLPLRIAIA